jgi:putative flippase GtrA
LLPLRSDSHKTNLKWGEAVKYLENSKIFNFMVVGGIGYVLNMVLYYFLSAIFKTEVTFLGQHFFLPPFIISSVTAMVCNYELNKYWTFRKLNEKSLGAARYFIMGSFSIMIDMLFLFLLVEYLHINPVIAAALAILIVFVMRYFIARKWIWVKEK